MGGSTSWDRFRRAIFCRHVCDAGVAAELCSAGHDPFNIGRGEAIDEGSVSVAMIFCMQKGMVEAAELVHRALKDFGFEQLPFKRFAQNAAFYYTITAFFLYEAFKEDVCSPVVQIVPMPPRFEGKSWMLPQKSYGIAAR